MPKPLPDTWRNRIVGYGVEDADQLLANPANWRIHPRYQQDALSGVLNEIGWVQNILVNKTTGHVVDGHLRAALAISAGAQVPVTYVELTEDEERLILATLDPIAAMAARDDAQLAELLASVSAEDAGLADLLASLELPMTQPTETEWGDALGGLATGDRAPFQQMTFTLHDEQAEQVKLALRAAMDAGPFVSDNENSNGNALARICETYLTVIGNG